MKTVKVTAVDTFSVSDKIEVVETSEGTHLKLEDGSLVIPAIIFLRSNGIDTWKEVDDEELVGITGISVDWSIEAE